MNLMSLFKKNKEKTVIYIVGCQRSGTTMLQQIMSQPSQFSYHSEMDKRAMLKHCRIKPYHEIEELIEKQKKAYIFFKPLNDSQYADKLLEIYPHSKAFWVYRQYSDVINSAVKKWGGEQKNIINWVVHNHEKQNALDEVPDDNTYKIYLEGMTSDTIDNLKTLASDDMSNEDGAALLWYIRNQIYFDLNLNTDNRVLLVKYEKLVSNPKQELNKLFRFINYSPSRDYSKEIFATSIGKSPVPNLNPKIDNLCNDLMDKLDSLYDAQQANA